MSKEYKQEQDKEIKEDDGIFLKGYKVYYHYNDEIKETYIYLDNIQESHVCESDYASLIEEQKEGRECNNANDVNANDVNVNDVNVNDVNANDVNVNVNVKELFDGLNASEETNKNVAVDMSKKPIVNNLIRNKAHARAVPIITNENKCSKEKPKLNVNKIKNIIEKTKNENRDCEKSVSIQNKIHTIIKKINNKIKAEVVKELMEYETIVENETKKNIDEDDENEIETKMNAFYHYILNKINSKI